jgi:hypothetical protein
VENKHTSFVTRTFDACFLSMIFTLCLPLIMMAQSGIHDTVTKTDTDEPLAGEKVANEEERVGREFKLLLSQICFLNYISNNYRSNYKLKINKKGA